MVERSLLPGPIVVALLTSRALLPLMFVVFLMAGETIHGGLFITIIRMAVLAGHLLMLSAEFVPGLVVIESDLFPLPLGMAVRACASRFSLVLVVFLMAGVAF